MERTDDSPRFEAEYDTKDAILYALSVGYGKLHDDANNNNEDDELRFVFEHHRSFTVAPTLALTFLFRAVSGGESSPGIPAFPPPMMQAMGVIPPNLVRDNDVSLDDYPLLHVHQLITWTQSLPIPKGHEKVKVSMQGRLRSVVPKDIGAFVTQEMSVRRSDDGALLCILDSTFLVMGLEPELVQSYGSSRRKREWNKGKLLLEVIHTVEDNAALLYRLASGDSNRIHVDQPPMGDRPILHGLCSMGIVSRYLQRLVGSSLSFLQSLECRFAKPVFIGDTLKIEVWSSPSAEDDVVFLVRNITRKNSIALSNGRASFQSRARL